MSTVTCRCPKQWCDHTNEIQKSIDQIGHETTLRYLPKGMKLHPCDLHGHFLAHYKDSNPLCPLCIPAGTEGNGTTASQVELYIDLRDALAPQPNPHS